MSEATELDQACPNAEVQARCQQNINEEPSPKEGTHWIDQILKLFHKGLPPILCRNDVVLVGCRLCLSAFWLSSTTLRFLSVDEYLGATSRAGSRIQQTIKSVVQLNRSLFAARNRVGAWMLKPNVEGNLACYFSIKLKHQYVIFGAAMCTQCDNHQQSIPQIWHDAAFLNLQPLPHLALAFLHDPKPLRTMLLRKRKTFFPPMKPLSA